MYWEVIWIPKGETRASIDRSVEVCLEVKSDKSKYRCGRLTSFFEYEMPYEKGIYLAAPVYVAVSSPECRA
jgi:hypothetical protein